MFWILSVALAVVTASVALVGARVVIATLHGRIRLAGRLTLAVGCCMLAALAIALVIAHAYPSVF